MPRDLSDVIHYFIPELGEEDEVKPAKLRKSEPPEPFESESPAALRIIALPIADSDFLRAAFAWNLVIEVARMGGESVLVVPPQDRETPLGPEAGEGPLGTEVVFADASDLGSLHRTALAVAVARGARAEEGGLVFVRVPPVCLAEASEGVSLLRWVLLLTSSDPREMFETYGLAKLLHKANLPSEVGITFHGMKELGAADEAFQKLAEVTWRRLGMPLSSYGALLDDLEVYRAIVAHRPIGLAHPQSPAAHSLRDVATMLLSRAREHELA